MSGQPPTVEITKRRRRLPNPWRVRGAIEPACAPDMPTPAEFGAEVTRLRLARGWSQDEAGRALGIGSPALSLIEKGKTRARPYMVAGFRSILRADAP